MTGAFHLSGGFDLRPELWEHKLSAGSGLSVIIKLCRVSQRGLAGGLFCCQASLSCWPQAQSPHHPLGNAAQEHLKPCWCVLLGVTELLAAGLSRLQHYCQGWVLESSGGPWGLVPLKR